LNTTCSTSGSRTRTRLQRCVTHVYCTPYVTMHIAHPMPCAIKRHKTTHHSHANETPPLCTGGSRQSILYTVLILYCTHTAQAAAGKVAAERWADEGGVSLDKLAQMREVLERWRFSGINRKVRGESMLSIVLVLTMHALYSTHCAFSL
jgi:hypothetical protein